MLIYYYLFSFFFSSTLYPAKSRLGRRDLLLRDFVPRALPSYQRKNEDMLNISFSRAEIQPTACRIYGRKLLLQALRPEWRL